MGEDEIDVRSNDNFSVKDDGDDFEQVGRNAPEQSVSVSPLTANDRLMDAAKAPCANKASVRNAPRMQSR